MDGKIFGELRDLVCERLEIEPERFTDQATFIADFGADSLDVVDLAMQIEEHFSILINDDDYVHFATVATAVAMIVAKQEGQAGTIEAQAQGAA